MLRESIAVLFLIVAGAGCLGLLEGVHDASSAGVTHRVGTVLLYAIATWCFPALVTTSVGLLLAIVLGHQLKPRRRAAIGGGLGLGGMVTLAMLLDGQGVLFGGLVGAVVATTGAWLLARRTAAVSRWPVAAWAVLALGWATSVLVMRPTETFGATTNGTPVVLIVADALRADALSAYGAERPSPHIDSIGERGWRIPDAVSTSSWTLPSMASLWTSREPGLHGVRTKAAVLDDELPVLAEHLSQHGYRTAAVISNPIIDPMRGFVRGFDVVRADTHQAEASLFWIGRLNRLARDRGWISGPNSGRKLTLPSLGPEGLRVRRTGYVAADEVTNDALDLLDTLGSGSFFLYVHYFDPHDPYLPHPPQIAWNEPAYSQENREALVEAYAGEVTFLDEQIGRLLAGLEERGLLDQALVVFTADHGEEFLEHGNWGHRASLYDELIRLPLLVSFPEEASTPGPPPPEASLLDVAPTILGTLGLPSLPGARGRDLHAARGEVVRYADRMGKESWLASVRRGQQSWIMEFPRSHESIREQAKLWSASLAEPPSGGVIQSWILPESLSGQVRAEKGLLTIRAEGIPRPQVRSDSWTAPRDGLLGVGGRVAGEGARLGLKLERRTEAGWDVVPGSHRTVSPTGGDWREVSLDPVHVTAGDQLRLALGPEGPLPEGAAWRVRNARFGLDDPRLIISGEVYDLRTDSDQRDDMFPGSPGEWKETLGLLLDYLAQGHDVTERPLDDEELERLRAMGYLR